MKNFTAGKYRQQREYESFTPSFINRHFAWENPQINMLMARAMQLLGELNAYTLLRPDVNFSIPLNKPVLYMSTFFEKHRTSYYDSLAMVRKSNDLEQWITFFLSGVVETVQDGIKTFREILKLQREYNTNILTLGSRAKNAQKLLRFMYATPIVNVRSVEKELGISFSSANRLLKSLMELGVLKETTDDFRNRLFVLEKYLNLFRS